ncbi:MAG: NADH-quinone oxidoreductase subunit M [Halobacteria archaeon]|nr:NADH-quinone oxidoreductase subunit M [Halobacteria archaeon]
MTWVSALIAVPIVAAVVTLFVKGDNSKYFAFIASLIPLALSLYVWAALFESTGNVLLDPGGIQLEERINWINIAGYQIQYFVGLDGVSMPLVLLTTLLTTLAIMSAWPAIEERQHQFYALMLFLEGALIGVFVTLDFLAFYVFWEGVLIPMYFLIAVWGTDEGDDRMYPSILGKIAKGSHRDSRYAAIKFFVYTNIASLIMFIGVVALFFNTGVQNLSLVELTQAIQGGQLGGAFGMSAEQFKLLAFLALFVGFAVKVPIVPLHTWLPDAHVKAPTPVSVILAGVLLKMGTYALLRFNFTMLSDVALNNAYLIGVVGVVSVIYGALLAMAQNDLKRIVAYSSISSMGYVIIGLAAYTQYAVGGATFQMLSHGLLSGLLFMVVGVIYNKAHTRDVHEISGLIHRMPIVATVFVAGAFGYMGLPGMSGFAAEIFVFLGSMGSDFLPNSTILVPVAMFGIVIVAGYLLFAMQRTLFGDYRAPEEYRDSLTDATLVEAIPLVVLILVIIVLGVWPDLAYGMIQDSTVSVVRLATGGV